MPCYATASFELRPHGAPQQGGERARGDPSRGIPWGREVAHCVMICIRNENVRNILLILTAKLIILLVTLTLAYP